MISRAIFLKWALNVGELKQKLEKAEVDIKQQDEFYVSTVPAGGASCRHENQ